MRQAELIKTHVIVINSLFGFKLFDIALRKAKVENIIKILWYISILIPFS